MSCCVPYCDAKKGDKHNMTFHRFPNDLDLKRKWIVAIGRKDSKTGKYWIPSKNSRVCSLHFSPRQLRPIVGSLHKGSIPYIFPDYSLPEYGTLIGEKELALVDLTAEELARTVQKKSKPREKTAKFRNKSSTITEAISIYDSAANLKNTKKRSCLEINLDENEPTEKSKKLSKANMTVDKSDKGNDLDCGLPNSDELPLADDDTFEKNKNNSSTDDNTKQTFNAGNSSQLSEQDNDQIVLYKETGFNKSKTNSATKIVDLSSSGSKNSHTTNKAKQPFQRVNVRNLPKDSTQIVKAMSSEESKDPEIQIVEIPLSLLEKNNFTIEIPSDICLNKNSSLSSNTFTVSSTKIKKNVMKPVKETIPCPPLKNMTGKDITLLNRLKKETMNNKKLTLELFELQEENENLFFSNESIEEKISLYNLKELKTGVTNADKKALFLHDQLRSLTEGKTMWSECTLQFADKLEENLPACYNFLRKTNVINLPPPKQEREGSTSQTIVINID